MGLVDRVLAAVAKEQNLLLVHTDSVLKNHGFPQNISPIHGTKIASLRFFRRTPGVRLTPMRYVFFFC